MTALLNLYKKLCDKIDLPFLLFILTISPNKIYLKVIALLFIFSAKPRFDFVFNKKIPLFYPFIIILCFIHFIFLGRDYSLIHIVEFLTGVFYWLICYAYLYQAYLFVEENCFRKINNTLITFVYINFAVCLLNYFSICIATKTLLPFFLGVGEYGSSTGDHITGLFGHPSYINAIINTLFAIYFLHHKKSGLFMLTTFCAVLSFANIVNLLFIAILLIYLVFSPDNKRRMLITANLLLCFCMYFFISPDNYVYVKRTLGLSVSNEKEIMPQVLEQEYSGGGKTPRQKVQYVNDSSAASQKIFMFDRNFLFKRSYDEYRTYYPIDITTNPGKKIAIIQTLKYLNENPLAAGFGAGVGNFSSRLAFQFSGRDSSRLFMRLPHYCSGYYFKNSLLIYDIMASLPREYHSIKHFPNNFMSQLLGEYGLAGLIIFLCFYVGFFYKKTGNKLFFMILLICISGYLMLDYLFEFFNVMLFFELLLFVNIKYQRLLISDPTDEKR